MLTMEKQLEFSFMEKIIEKEEKEKKWRREAEIRGRAWQIRHSYSARAIRSAQNGDYL